MSSKIKNILFDMGGVIFDIKKAPAIAKFHEIGVKDYEKYSGIFGQKGIFYDLEVGRIGEDEYMEKLCELAGGRHITREENLQAWHAHIQEIPQERIAVLDKLRPSYKLYLLTNTNPFMMAYMDSPSFSKEGRPISDYFDGMFCSYKLGYYKPDPEFFKSAIRLSGIKPEESLFLDDSSKNIDVAHSLGMEVILAREDGLWIEDLMYYLDN